MKKPLENRTYCVPQCDYVEFKASRRVMSGSFANEELGDEQDLHDIFFNE